MTKQIKPKLHQYSDVSTFACTPSATSRGRGRCRSCSRPLLHLIPLEICDENSSVSGPYQGALLALLPRVILTKRVHFVAIFVNISPFRSKRVEHWSRRLDHAFIHFASACMSYSTSGRIDYFLLNAAFNLDCAFRQFERRVRPRRNLVRIAISVLLYTLPVLRRGFYGVYIQLLAMFGLSAWLFAAYPVGGWSHSLFHIVLSFLPHLIMVSATKLQSCQPQIMLAAKCAVIAGKS